MKPKFLLPARFKKIGWIILIPSVVIGVLHLIFDWGPEILNVEVFAIYFGGFSDNKELFDFTRNNILDEILGTFTILGGLMVAFSEEFDEDELISSMRLECLVWAIYCNYGILVVAFFLFYDFTFFWVMVLNLFTPLILFIIRFNWLVAKFRKSLKG
jgi:hypothetical protein